MWSLLDFRWLPLCFKMILSIIPTFPHDKSVVGLILNIVVLIILHRLHRLISCRIRTTLRFHLGVECKLVWFWVLRYHRLMDHLLLNQLINFFLILVLVYFVLRHRKGRDDLSLLGRSLLVSYHLAVRVHGQIRQMGHGVLLVVLGSGWGFWFTPVVGLFVISLLTTFRVIDVQ